ncbi:hypothetical protein ACFLV5_05710 [Chloroflexota bacterium]
MNKHDSSRILSNIRQYSKAGIWWGVPLAIIALFGLLGLVGAYVIQRIFLKGKPIPTLPPIGALTLVGLLIIL